MRFILRIYRMAIFDGEGWQWRWQRQTTEGKRFEVAIPIYRLANGKY
jgi:hypothetical protein